MRLAVQQVRYLLRAIAHASPLTRFLPFDKRLCLEPHPASPEKALPRCRRAGFFPGHTQSTGTCFMSNAEVKESIIRS